MRSIIFNPRKHFRSAYFGDIQEVRPFTKYSTNFNKKVLKLKFNTSALCYDIFLWKNTPKTTNKKKRLSDVKFLSKFHFLIMQLYYLNEVGHPLLNSNKVMLTFFYKKKMMKKKKRKFALGQKKNLFFFRI